MIYYTEVLRYSYRATNPFLLDILQQKGSQHLFLYCFRPTFTRVYLLERVLYSGTSLYTVGDLPGCRYPDI
eukprot:SAG11_NODE_3600_length_2345_cov_21.782280_2_plen_71_part_00